MKNPGTRQQPRLKIERTSEEFNRKALGLEFVKRANRMRKMRNWTLWRGGPSPKREKRLHME
jgi:hypothetical protein